MVECNSNDGGWEDSNMEGGEDDDDWGRAVDDENGVDNFANAEIELPLRNDKGYKAVKSQMVSQQVLVRIQELEDLYSLPLDPLIIIAQHYKWNPDKMQEWLLDENQDQLKHKLGLEFDRRLIVKHPEMNDSLPGNHGGYCTICYEVLEESNSQALSCGHTFCGDCWARYLQTKVQSGFLGIDARCMQVGCNMKVGHTVFERVLASSPKDKETYWKWLCKSFTDDNKNIKWCPSLACEYCCERQDQGRMLYEVTCECGTEFCFMCGQYTHKPCDCSTAQQWNDKASAESENVNWISANTKPCPQCSKSIEKNQGCNHMTCAQCRYEFCWICMGNWKDHGSATGGYYKCNLYEEKKKDTSFIAEEAKREKAVTELQRYMWYYERFANHDRSGKLAIKLLPVIKQKCVLLNQRKSYPPKELDFLEHGCETVIQCREILKWTYAYGYYLDRNLTEVKRGLFQQWQSDLEKYCDHLHGLVEQDLEQYMDPNITDRGPFYKYRGQLTSFFEATKNFYTNLVKGLEETD